MIEGSYPLRRCSFWKPWYRVLKDPAVVLINGDATQQKIQKELSNLKKKLAFTLDFKEKSVYLYYLGLIHEIIGQPLIAYDYYEKSIKHDGSNNLPHLAIGNIDRNRKL